jgi:hypothetical protein
MKLGRRALRLWAVLLLSLSVPGQSTTSLFQADEANPESWAPTGLYRGRSEVRQREGDVNKGFWRMNRAVSLGLDWLSAQQATDGHWDALTAVDAGRGTPPPRAVAHTALAVLALLGKGHTPAVGERREVVRRAVRWLVQQQAASGLVTSAGEEEPGHAHALATCALVEAASLAPFPQLVERARAALGWLRVHAQCDGPWAELALALARHAPWREESVDRSAGRTTATRGGGATILVAYLNSAGREPRIPPEWVDRAREEMRGEDLELRFFAAAGLYQMDGPEWESVRRLVEGQYPTQCLVGERRGSWDPNHATASRVMQTALTVMSLQTVYRYHKLYLRRLERR